MYCDGMTIIAINKRIDLCIFDLNNKRLYVQERGPCLQVLCLIRSVNIEICE
jgi:hypothetical protein